MNNQKPNRFYVHWFHRNSCHIMDRELNIPVFDGSPNGDDKPLIFRDEDKAREVCDRMNGLTETDL